LRFDDLGKKKGQVPVGIPQFGLEPGFASLSPDRPEKIVVDKDFVGKESPP